MSFGASPFGSRPFGDPEQASGGGGTDYPVTQTEAATGTDTTSCLIGYAPSVTEAVSAGDAAAAAMAAAHPRDDAEAALVVAAFRDLEIRVVARRQPDALRRHEVDEGIVLRRQVLVHGADDVLVGMRSRDLEHARMALEDALGSRAEAARHDNAAVLAQCLADGREAFLQAAGHGNGTVAASSTADGNGQVAARLTFKQRNEKLQQLLEMPYEDDGIGVRKDE